MLARKYGPRDAVQMTRLCLSVSDLYVYIVSFIRESAYNKATQGKMAWGRRQGAAKRTEGV